MMRVSTFYSDPNLNNSFQKSSFENVETFVLWLKICQNCNFHTLKLVKITICPFLEVPNFIKIAILDDHNLSKLQFWCSQIDQNRNLAIFENNKIHQKIILILKFWKKLIFCQFIYKECLDSGHCNYLVIDFYLLTRMSKQN